MHQKYLLDNSDKLMDIFIENYTELQKFNQINRLKNDSNLSVNPNDEELITFDITIKDVLCQMNNKYYDSNIKCNHCCKINNDIIKLHLDKKSIDHCKDIVDCHTNNVDFSSKSTNYYEIKICDTICNLNLLRFNRFCIKSKNINDKIIIKNAVLIIGGQHITSLETINYNELYCNIFEKIDGIPLFLYHQIKIYVELKNIIAPSDLNIFVQFVKWTKKLDPNIYMNYFENICSINNLNNSSDIHSDKKKYREYKLVNVYIDNFEYNTYPITINNNKKECILEITNIFKSYISYYQINPIPDSIKRIKSEFNKSEYSHYVLTYLEEIDFDHIIFFNKQGSRYGRSYDEMFCLCNSTNGDYNEYNHKKSYENFVRLSKIDKTIFNVEKLENMCISESYSDIRKFVEKYNIIPSQKCLENAFIKKITTK